MSYKAQRITINSRNAMSKTAVSDRMYHILAIDLNYIVKKDREFLTTIY
jgi:hypothetical protein